MTRKGPKYLMNEHTHPERHYPVNASEHDTAWFQIGVQLFAGPGDLLENLYAICELRLEVF